MKINQATFDRFASATFAFALGSILGVLALWMGVDSWLAVLGAVFFAVKTLDGMSR